MCADVDDRDRRKRGGHEGSNDERVDEKRKGALPEAGELDAVELLQPDGLAGGEGLHEKSVEEQGPRASGMPSKEAPPLDTPVIIEG
jgi:hypothetical protein